MLMVGTEGLNMSDDTPYSRNRVLDFFIGLTPDSRPMKPGVCPVMTACPWMRTPADATRADPDLVWNIDRVRGRREWSDMTAGEILSIVRTMP